MLNKDECPHEKILRLEREIEYLKEELKDAREEIRSIYFELRYESNRASYYAGGPDDY